MCRFAARVAAALDRYERIALLPLEDPAAAEAVSALPDSARLSSWHLVRPDSRVSSRGQAGIDLLDALGHRRASAVAARAAEPIERLYSFVAGHRDVLGRFVPNGPAPRRYP